MPRLPRSEMQAQGFRCVFAQLREKGFENYMNYVNAILEFRAL